MSGHTPWNQILHKYPHEEPKPAVPPIMAYKIKGEGPAGIGYVWVESFADALPWIEDFSRRYSHVTVVRRLVRLA